MHFPHSGDTDDCYECTVAELQSFLQNIRGSDIFFMGDFNCVPLGDDRRSCMLQSALEPLGLFCVSSGSSTWHGNHTSRELDYFWVNSNLCQSVVRGIEGLRASVVCGGRQEIGSDHDLIVLDYILSHATYHF